MSTMHALRFSFPIADVAEDKGTYLGITVRFFVSKLTASFASKKHLFCVAIVANMTGFLASVANKVVDVNGMGGGGSRCQRRIVSIFEFWVNGTDGRPGDAVSYG
jgi:hypothetical protein